MGSIKDVCHGLRGKGQWHKGYIFAECEKKSIVFKLIWSL